ALAIMGVLSIVLFYFYHRNKRNRIAILNTTFSAEPEAISKPQSAPLKQIDDAELEKIEEPKEFVIELKQRLLNQLDQYCSLQAGSREELYQQLKEINPDIETAVRELYEECDLFLYMPAEDNRALRYSVLHHFHAVTDRIELFGNQRIYT
ncbi:MAG: hypothetical protein H7Y03_02210, partial [Chitinophagaceae bacterium]|nr:hypothetical protein [Chitinophagaceae bacterium]